MDQQEGWLGRLGAVVVNHVEAVGYRVVEVTDDDGWATYVIEVPEKDGVVRLSLDGEVFALSFPGGYSWAEFAYADEDREETLGVILRFLDAYAAPDTAEVTVPRRVLRDRKELRVSNGAVLHARGWSSGPPS